MAAPGQEWHIRPRAAACLLSQRDFEDGEAFMSRLVPGEEGYLREDYALDQWSDDLKQDALSFWQSTFHVPPPPGDEPLKSESVEQTLRQLMEQNDPEDAAAIFLLGMQLERKRQLVPRDRQRRPDGRLLRIYEHRTTGESFVIPDPEWSLDEVAAVQQQVAVRLGWVDPPPVDEPEPTPSDDSASPSESNETTPAAEPVGAATLADASTGEEPHEPA